MFMPIAMLCVVGLGLLSPVVAAAPRSTLAGGCSYRDDCAIGAGLEFGILGRDIPSLCAPKTLGSSCALRETPESRSVLRLDHSAVHLDNKKVKEGTRGLLPAEIIGRSVGMASAGGFTGWPGMLVESSPDEPDCRHAPVCLQQGSGEPKSVSTATERTGEAQQVRVASRLWSRTRRC